MSGKGWFDGEEAEDEDGEANHLNRNSSYGEKRQLRAR